MVYGLNTSPYATGKHYYTRNNQIFDSTGKVVANARNATEAIQRMQAMESQAMLGLAGFNQQGGGMVGGQQQTETIGVLASAQPAGGSPQQTADQQAAIDAQYKLAEQSLTDAYDKNVRGTVSNMNRRGMFGSSVANEDLADVNKLYTQGLSDLAAKKAADAFNVQAQNIANQAALQNMWYQQQQNRRQDEILRLSQPKKKPLTTIFTINSNRTTR